jgi:glycosyltransferase involved in cell wall biosynthesis
MSQAKEAPKVAERPFKLLYFIGVDWFFYSHFLDRAIAAKQAGYDVIVLTHVTRHDDTLANHGIRLLSIPFKRRSLSPLELISNLIHVIRVLKKEKPDIVHQVALKPILIGSVACRFLGIRHVISAVVGLGYAFSSDSGSAKFTRRILTLLFRFVLDRRYTKTVFENTDDLTQFVNQGWVRQENAVLIRGAGVDIEHFRPIGFHKVFSADIDPLTVSALKGNNTETCSNVPIVILLSRMLWDKGIGEFVQAARHVRQEYGNSYARFVLVGNPDEDNRGAVTKEQLKAWQDEGVIEWWGFKSDVRHVLAQATISCLPSYREGLPKSLLESLAMGLPCISTDVPGCREAVIDGLNGILVPARDFISLAKAIAKLLNNPALCCEYGKVSREMAVEAFSVSNVNFETLELYRRMTRRL